MDVRNFCLDFLNRLVKNAFFIKKALILTICLFIVRFVDKFS